MGEYRRKDWSSGFFMFGMAALVAAMIPACGGGGSSGTGQASNPPQAVADHKIHVSSAEGVVVIPASSNPAVVRQITFTPSNSSDVVQKIEVSGTFTSTAGNPGSNGLGWEILDSAGNVILNDQFEVAVMNVGTNVTFRDSVTVPLTVSPFITIRLTAVTTGTWVGQVNSTQFRIFTAENVTIVSPSGNISG
jgi:hypothetical protein